MMRLRKILINVKSRTVIERGCFLNKKEIAEVMLWCTWALRCLQEKYSWKFLRKEMVSGRRNASTRLWTERKGIGRREMLFCSGGMLRSRMLGKKCRYLTERPIFMCALEKKPLVGELSLKLRRGTRKTWIFLPARI